MWEGDARNAVDRVSVAVGGPGRLLALLVVVAALRGVLAGVQDPWQGIGGFGEWAGVVGAVGRHLAPVSSGSRLGKAGWACGIGAILATLGTLVAGRHEPTFAAACAVLSASLAVASVAVLARLLPRKETGRAS